MRRNNPGAANHVPVICLSYLAAKSVQSTPDNFVKIMLGAGRAVDDPLNSLIERKYRPLSRGAPVFPRPSRAALRRSSPPILQRQRVCMQPVRAFRRWRPKWLQIAGTRYATTATGGKRPADRKISKISLFRPFRDLGPSNPIEPPPFRRSLDASNDCVHPPIPSNPPISLIRP